MNCEEAQKVFSPYLDGALTGGALAGAEAHLDACPACRLRLDETRALLRALSAMERPQPPAGLAAAVRDALLIERAARANRPPRTLVEAVFDWVQPRVMPYTVGALASLILFVGVLSALRPHVAAFRALAEAAAGSDADVALIESAGFDVTQPITPENLAANRMPFAVESPSLNPRGALAALARSSESGRPGDDDMMVVADVYGNGQASLAAVMEPPRNPRMLDELEDALRKNPAFVPATLDRRPQTMRVVFVLQRMNVREVGY